MIQFIYNDAANNFVILLTVCCVNVNLTCIVHIYDISYTFQINHLINLERSQNL